MRRKDREITDKSSIEDFISKHQIIRIGLIDNGEAVTAEKYPSPKDHYDLEDWTIYQKFMSDNLDSKSVKAEVDTYLYGEGDVFIANIYEVAAFTGRGEQFLSHPDVHWQGSSEFTVYPPVMKAQKLVDNLGFI